MPNRNTVTIHSIPPAVLPDDLARAYLLRQARAGRDVYAYEAAGSRTWNLWLEGIRVPVRDWAAMWYHSQGGRLERGA